MVLEEIFERAKARRLVRTASEFSTNWCGRERNYLCQTTARGATSACTLIRVARRCQELHQLDLFEAALRAAGLEIPE